MLYIWLFIPGEIKMTSAVDPLPANSLIGVTGITVTDVVAQKGTLRHSIVL